jgi:hypothetical protein
MAKVKTGPVIPLKRKYTENNDNFEESFDYSSQTPWNSSTPSPLSSIKFNESSLLKSRPPSLANVVRSSSSGASESSAKGIKRRR